MSVYPWRAAPTSPALLALIEKSVAYVKAMTPEEYAAMIEVQRQSYVRAEMSWNEDSTVQVVR